MKNRIILSICILLLLFPLISSFGTLIDTKTIVSDIWVNESGDNMTGDLNMTFNDITGVGRLTLKEDGSIYFGDINTRIYSGATNDIFLDATTVQMWTNDKVSMRVDGDVNDFFYFGTDSNRPYIQSYGSNLELRPDDGIVSITGNITADFFFGNGSKLTGIAGGSETDPYWTGNSTNMQVDCPAGNYSYGVFSNGTFKCRDDVSGAAAESDPKWTANYTIYNTTWSTNTDTWSSNFTNYYTKSEVNTNISTENTTMNAYVNAQDTSFNNSMKSYVDAQGEALWNANYSTFLTHITWANAVNGTLAESSTILGWNYYNSTNFDIADYSTTATILGWNFYNSTDFDIADYPTLAEILAFNYYNSTDFSISDYFTKAGVLGFSYYNSTDFDINDYSTSAIMLGYNYYNSTDFDINDYRTLTNNTFEADIDLNDHNLIDVNDIGTTTDEIDDVYIGTNQRIYFGDGQESSIYFNGSHLIWDAFLSLII